MAGIIWIVIFVILIVVYNYNKKINKRNREKAQEEPEYRQKMPNIRMPQGPAQHNAPRTKPPQQSAGARQRYTNPPAQQPVNVHPAHPDEGEIMEAAKENVTEYASDKMLNEQNNLAQEISDLMIKGPNTEIPNERDFLAEAMDMLNSLH